MDEPDDTEYDEVIEDPRRRLSDPKGVAGGLVRRFGTPDWPVLRAGAEALAGRFDIPDADALGAAMVLGLVDVRIAREELRFIQVNGNEHLAPPPFFECLVELNISIEVLRRQFAAMRDVMLPHLDLSPERMDGWANMLDDFEQGVSLTPLAGPDRNKDGRKSRLSLDARKFLAVLAGEWWRQTGRRPVAYLDAHSRTPRGDFWPFAIEACAVGGVDQPSIDSVEEWLKKDLPTHAVLEGDVLVIAST